MPTSALSLAYLTCRGYVNGLPVLCAFVFKNLGLPPALGTAECQPKHAVVLPHCDEECWGYPDCRQL